MIVVRWADQKRQQMRQRLEMMKAFCSNEMWRLMLVVVRKESELAAIRLSRPRRLRLSPVLEILDFENANHPVLGRVGLLELGQLEVLVADLRVSHAVIAGWLVWKRRPK